MPFVLGGKTLRLNRPFTHEGVQYPANWLHLASDEDKVKIGIEILPDVPVEPDDPFLDEIIVSSLKQDLKAKAKDTVAHALAESDWYIIRQTEEGIPVPEDIAQYRKNLRKELDLVRVRIDAASNMEELEEAAKSDLIYLVVR
jgi:hypothetical protein